MEGLKTLTRLKPRLERLRMLRAERDLAGNRKLPREDVVGLVLLSFLNPLPVGSVCGPHVGPGPQNA